MRYLAFATDYDGTLATDGNVNEETVRALERVKASGRKLLIVTGREFDDLQRVFPHTELFDRIVAENGAVLYNPREKTERVLAARPSEEFLTALRKAGVRFATGRAIVASWSPSETVIMRVIKELGLDLQVIFNKGAVMVLPSGVNKATGLRAALKSLQLSFHNTVAIGDAENDHAFLAASECGVAVANALPALKERADIVTEGDHGNGVVELLQQLRSDDLQSYDEKIKRSAISIGVVETAGDTQKPGDQLCVVPNRRSVLVAGASASGKSSAVAGILEEMEERDYQFCLIDPEGDFEQVAGAITIGSPSEKPEAAAVARALEDTRSVVINLMGVPLGERPNAFPGLLQQILQIREKTGRPHWLVVDEAHHMLPSEWSPASGTMAEELGATILVTVHPEHVAPAALAFVDVVVATGNLANNTLQAFAKAAGVMAPVEVSEPPETGKALVWFARRSQQPVIAKMRLAKAERRRHRRNYAQGELSPEQSFYFRGPEGKLKLRAQNLTMFLQIGEGVGDESWEFHARQGDYSNWFANVIKDEELAEETKEIEQTDGEEVAERRRRLREAVEKRYTAPA